MKKFLITLMLSAGIGMPGVKLFADIIIESGPLVRVPGMTAPTLLRANSATGGPSAGNIQWTLNGELISEENTPFLFVTQPGTYRACKLVLNPTPEEPDNQACFPLGEIIVPALDHYILITGPNPLNETTGTSLCINSNAANLITRRAWIRNGAFDGSESQCRQGVEFPGTYAVDITYTYNGRSATVRTANVTLNPSARRPTYSLSNNTYNPVTPPVITVSNASSYTFFQFFKNGRLVPSQNSSSFTVDGPGTYIIGGFTRQPGEDMTFTNDIVIPQGDIPIPRVSASNGGRITSENPLVQLSTTDGYNLGYTWSFNGLFINQATTRTLTATQMGSYTVRACAVYPDGSSQCQSSLPFEVTGEITHVNYVRKQVPLIENVTSLEQLDGLPFTQMNTSTSYLDGFARPLAEIQRAASPRGNDIVTIHKYDFTGREVQQILPFVRRTSNGAFQFNPDPIRPVLEFYQQGNDKIANTAFPYAETVYEASPLNRVLQQGAPGEDWQLSTHRVKTIAYANNLDENVWIWTSTAQGGLRADQSYATGTLTVTVMTDENGNSTRTLKDKNGQTVFTEKTVNASQKLRTYFVFDDMQRLAFVIPPKTVEELRILQGSVSISADVLARECYSYVYDERSRVTIKNIPGAGSSYIVYDPWDRPVLTQHANQRTRSKWSFSKYDAFDRAVLTGEITLAGSQAAVQQAVNTFYAGVASSPTLRYEETGGTIHGYTNRSYPVLTSEAQVYTASYFDNYNFLTQFGTAYQFVPESTLGITASSPNVTGLLTGVKTVILGTTNYLKTASFYDPKHRLIQVITDNGLGGADRVSNQLDFTGKILKAKTVHNGIQPVTILEEFTYDHVARKLKTYQTINGGPRIVLCDYQYNELGQLVEKNMHSADGNTYLQSLDYTYNIRGWLQQVNPEETETNTTYPDQYGFSLSYTTRLDIQSDPFTIFHPSYNGNIAAFAERRPGTTDALGFFKSVYLYQYDTRDQLTQANYIQPSNPVQNGVYSMPQITYDANGNIRNLQRRGIKTDGTPGLIDNLNYRYNGNQLIQVDDSADPTKGFINR